jgi:hypothetical protein
MVIGFTAASENGDRLCRPLRLSNHVAFSAKGFDAMQEVTRKARNPTRYTIWPEAHYRLNSEDCLALGAGKPLSPHRYISVTVCPKKRRRKKSPSVNS